MPVEPTNRTDLNLNGISIKGQYRVFLVMGRFVVSPDGSSLIDLTGVTDFLKIRGIRGEVNQIEKNWPGGLK